MKRLLAKQSLLFWALKIAFGHFEAIALLNAINRGYALLMGRKEEMRLK